MLIITILMTITTPTNYHTAEKKSAGIGIKALFIYEGIVFCICLSLLQI